MSADPPPQMDLQRPQHRQEIEPQYHRVMALHTVGHCAPQNHFVQATATAPGRAFSLIVYSLQSLQLTRALQGLYHQK